MSETSTAAVPATAITWFEIPVTDLARAQHFYETIFERPLRAGVEDGSNIAIFPAQERGVRGCLVETAHPSPHGTMVYLDATGRLDRTLELAAANGGRVELAKTELPRGQGGWIAKIADSEGNRVGLHAMS
jgi:predicted enzyme related to lactoylglutathione lyase